MLSLIEISYLLTVPGLYFVLIVPDVLFKKRKSESLNCKKQLGFGLFQ